MSALRFLPAVVMGVTFVAGGCSGQGPGKKGDPAVDGVNVATGQTSFTLTAADLATAARTDEEGTNKKYVGKTLEVSGEVDSVRPDEAQAMITLKAGEELFPVVCWTRLEEPWTKMARGQQVKLRGRYEETVLGVALHDCEIVHSPGPGVPNLTSVELAQQAEADRGATFKKHGGRQLVLAGKVVRVKEDDAGDIVVDLVGSNNTRVMCLFGKSILFVKDKGAAGGSPLDSLTSIKEGEQLRLIGEVSEFPDPGTVSLRACLRLKGKP